MQYGYMQDKTSALSADAASQEDETKIQQVAVKTFQKMAGLPQTGLLDGATLTKMTQKRCGVRDVTENSDSDRKTRNTPRGKI